MTSGKEDNRITAPCKAQGCSGGGVREVVAVAAVVVVVVVVVLVVVERARACVCLCVHSFSRLRAYVVWVFSCKIIAFLLSFFLAWFLSLNTPSTPVLIGGDHYQQTLSPLGAAFSAPEALMPNLDMLAGGSTIFTNAYAQV